MELKHKDVWTGTYRGVPVEIVRWTMDGIDGFTPTHNVWNYYITITEGMVREEDRPGVFLELGEPDDKGRRFWSYHESSLSNLDWHGGMTFYEVREACSIVSRHVKAGCDYNHIWDEDAGWPYTVESVFQDAKRTIDDLRDKIALRWRDSMTGAWFDTEEQAKEAGEKWRAEYLAKQAEKGAA